MAVVSALASYAPSLLRLEQLGAVHGTDKVDRWHTHVGQPNCDVYERYLKPLRRQRFTLLEVGVYRGASLRMWQAYFPKARIRGLDIDPATAELGLDVTIGSQADDEVLQSLLAPDLKVVIDDGSHVNELTLATFKYVFPRLQPGAIYVIEDTLCSYEPAHPDWSGMAYNTGLVLENVRADFDAFVSDLLHDCDLGPERTVSFLHFWPGLVVIGRA